MLIVQKFGGSSVADAEKLAQAADAVAEAYTAGHQVAAVVSAQGDTTDRLVEKAREITPAPDLRELDALLASGEQASAALLAMALRRREIPAVSLTGWQCGIHTDGRHGDARIERVETERLARELSAGRVVVAAGFQGIDSAGDLTTLGRGGSDTTAVALADALGAARCRIFTDVDGIYTADPRLVPGARRLDEIGYQDMLALASLGSRVLHDRCVALAMRRGVVLEVLSAAPPRREGTRVGPAGIRKYAGVTYGADRVSLVGPGAEEDPDTAPRIRRALARAGIALHTERPGVREYSVFVPPEQTVRALQAIHDEFFTPEA